METVALAALVGGVVGAWVISTFGGGHSSSAPAASSRPLSATQPATTTGLEASGTGRIESGGTILYFPYSPYHNAGRGLWAITSSGHRRLVIGGAVCCASSSPTGRMLLRVQAHDGRMVEMVVTPGSPPKQIRVSGLTLGPAIWASTDGRIVAWASHPGDPHSRGLYLIGRSGTVLRRITHPSAGVTQTPVAVSPDGTRLVFQQASHPSVGLGTLMAVRLDGGPPRRLSPPRTYTLCCFSLGTPDTHGPASWSPNGRWVAVAATRPGPAQKGLLDQQSGTGELGPTAVFIVSADGAQSHQVTEWGAGTTDVQWSPNGRWIAFDRQIRWRPSKHELFIVPPFGQHHLQPVASLSSTGGSCCAAWSPNSKALVYQDWQNGVINPPGTNLYVTNIDGSGVRRLIHAATSVIGYSWYGNG
jgi:dipeptidyl aminopeptidase/acylaminoacyl peptidase